MPTEEDIGALVLDAIGDDQTKQGMFSIFWNMYINSQLAELMVGRKLRPFEVIQCNDCLIGHIMHLIIEFLSPKITVDALGADTTKLFISQNHIEDDAVRVWGREFRSAMDAFDISPADYKRFYSLFFGNYMRAGMSSVLHVIRTNALWTRKSLLISFVDECFTGEKNYPRMVWDKRDPFLAIMQYRTERLAWENTYISKWKPPLERTIEENLRDWLNGGFEQDLYGRRRLKEWDTQINSLPEAARAPFLQSIAKIPSGTYTPPGKVLLQQYRELTSGPPPVSVQWPPGLAQYHYACFWHWVLQRVSQGKAWNPTERGLTKKDVAYLLFKNREVIVECLAPYVPPTEADKLTKDAIENMLGEEPATYSYYQSQQIANIQISPANKLDSWDQQGFQVNQTTLDKWLGQITWTVDSGNSVGKPRENSELSRLQIANKSGKLYTLRRIVGSEKAPTIMLKAA